MTQTLSTNEVMQRLLGRSVTVEMKSASQNFCDFGDINYYHPLYGSGIKLMIKKIIRKLFASIGFPIVDRQRRYNELVADKLDRLVGLACACNMQAEEISALRQRVEALESR